MSLIVPIRKILIANRGEIAVRIIRTCAELGIETVAIFSDADRTALHVRMADEAYPVGPAPSIESYLNSDRIIGIARQAGVDAIHPGYGFLAENADFALACETVGIRFIGPASETIRSMGDKTAARALMERTGVPMAPGTVEPIEKWEEAKQIAAQIGYPVLIKAASGGGGKGMRIVYDPDQFQSAFDAAGREAANAFGDARVFLEKYIMEPRHIEFQIMADSHGHIVHLFERECSIQRRHQKVIEEAPSPIMTDDLREQMGKAAVDAARSCNYVGAGTIEFLVDADRNFYFMEMNTRLQVEHAVTEWITGLDLVREQICIAEGQPISFRQEDLSINGHAIECRIYAEDPDNDFLPGPGQLLRNHMPGGHGVRVDSGVEQGDEVSVHYDPMISKVTTWGADRTEAIDRMRRALAEYEIAGVPTTISFCQFVLQSEPFREGQISTHFVANHFTGIKRGAPDPQFEETIARSAAAIWELQSRDHVTDQNSTGSGQLEYSNWRRNRTLKERGAGRK